MKKTMKRCVGLLMATLMLCSSFSASDRKALTSGC